MPLTKEERHALATRIRLGETVDLGAGVHLPVYFSGDYTGAKSVTTLNALGVVIGHLSRHGDAMRWEDGTVSAPPWTASAGRLGVYALTYLEKE